VTFQHSDGYSRANCLAFYQGQRLFHCGLFNNHRQQESLDNQTAVDVYSGRIKHVLNKRTIRQFGFAIIIFIKYGL